MDGPQFRGKRAGELKQWIAYPDFHADLLPIVASDGEPRRIIDA